MTYISSLTVNNSVLTTFVNNFPSSTTINNFPSTVTVSNSALTVDVNTFKEPFLEIEKGNFSGHSVINKFGRGVVGATLGPITISGVYKTPTTATTLEFISSAAADSSSGTGAREITVEGLDSTWAESVQTLTTNGTSAVTLGTPLTRLYRWYVSKSGSYADATTGSHAGTLTIRDASSNDTWSQIKTTPFPMAQSEIGVYSVATGKTGFISDTHIFVDSTKATDVILFQRLDSSITAAPFKPMRVVRTFIGVSENLVYEPRTHLGPFTGPCDIGFMATQAGGSGDISVDFEIILVNSNLVT